MTLRRDTARKQDVMPRNTPRARAGALLAAALILAGPSAGRSDENNRNLRTVLEQQARQLDEQRRELEDLQRRIDEVGAARAAPDPGGEAPAPGTGDLPDSEAVKKLVADCLRQNPGAGMPPSVQTGYLAGQGFVIRSAPNPDYVKWDDESRIPFEFELHGRVQIPYIFYKVTDDANHETGAHQQAANANSHRFADYSQLEVKRCDLVFAGTVYDPDLHFYIDIDGTTRGLTGLQNNKVVQNAGAFDPNASASSPIGGSTLVDHLVRIRYAYVYYDFHGAAAERGCGPDCPDGTYRYAPTYSLVAGKMTPFYGLEQYLTTTNERFVEYSMANWYFNADDNNKLMAAGTQIKAADDRFYMQAIVTNGSEAQFPNNQMDDLPGFIMGFWYDLGGSWNGARKRWDLFGGSLDDIDYSPRLVARLGGSLNLVPLDRRSLYGDAEQSRYFVMPAGPNGTRLINLLNGDGGTSATTLKGAHAVDAFDGFFYNVFAAAKYRGFSLSNEWWLRDLTGFKAAPDGTDIILYTYTDPRTRSPVAALFPDKALLDYGMTLEAGYFLVPKKLELVARWSWIRGDSGDILGDGTSTSFRIPNGVPAPTTKGSLERVQVNQGAFTHFHEADEYGVGVNYYFHREQLKWQTDFSLYQGGNPAGGGQSAAGFIPGLDGYMVRTQLQLAF
jgi:hypothetical protein